MAGDNSSFADFVSPMSTFGSRVVINDADGDTDDNGDDCGGNDRGCWCSNAADGIEEVPPDI